MTTIRHDYLSAALTNAHLPRVGYHNLFRDGVVNVSSQDDDHPKELAFDGKTYDGWRTNGEATAWIDVTVASQNADYMAIAAHTLAGCTVTPQRDNAGSWTDLDSAYVVPDNRPIIWEWTSVASTKWRLLIQNASGAVQVGAIHVGLRTELLKGVPVGFSPPNLNEDVKYSNPMSEGGQLLGRHRIRRGARVDVKTNPVTFTWASEDWLDFIESARDYPVFFWWTFLGKGEIVYGAVDDDGAQFSQPQEVTTKFRVTGINR